MNDGDRHGAPKSHPSEDVIDEIAQKARKKFDPFITAAAPSDSAPETYQQDQDRPASPGLAPAAVIIPRIKIAPAAPSDVTVNQTSPFPSPSFNFSLLAPRPPETPDNQRDATQVAESGSTQVSQNIRTPDEEESEA